MTRGTFLHIRRTRPDVYYGAVAEHYDASRSVKAKWHAEMAAVESFVTDGPVLDVPFGTGRFVPIYLAKGLLFRGIDVSADMLAIARRKYPGVKADLGSVFDLHFADGEFATAVCVRFLEWYPLEQAKRTLDRLRRLAQTLIITITHGIKGNPEAYTYDFHEFLGDIDGLLIERRQVTAHVRDMISEAFKLRPARWSDVVEQFFSDYPSTAERHIQRLADKHAGFFGLPPIPISADTVTVRAEYWNEVKIRQAVEALVQHRFKTDVPPRNIEAPMTVIERDGVVLIIDGRKRANRWMLQPWPHPVLVVRPK